MSCLYADMILDLRKNSMNEVEKRFIDEKLKTGKKRFCPKVPASTNAQREIFFLCLHASQITKEVTQIFPDSQN